MSQTTSDSIIMRLGLVKDLEGHDYEKSHTWSGNLPIDESNKGTVFVTRPDSKPSAFSAESWYPTGTDVDYGVNITVNLTDAPTRWTATPRQCPQHCRESC